MPKFISAGRLKAAVDALSDARGKAALMDFLILKRTLALKGVSAVAITQTEPSYLQATKEFAGAKGSEKIDIKAEKEIFNVFAAKDTKQGFRSGKYISNGTGSTIGGNPWQAVISLSSAKPRAASLKEGYVDHLADLLVKEGPKAKMPSLSECALWNFRNADIEGVVAGTTDPKARAKALRDKFVFDYKLTEGEIARLFSDEEAELADADLAPVVTAPSTYLPGAATCAAAADHQACSFELVAALAAKPFVILTGASGTGKSRSTLKLAERLQEHYGASAKGQLFQLVTIGPDWTSPKKLIGYRTPFGAQRIGADGKETNESYEITETLRVILRAWHPASTKIPHFLIFDEMNLSHVERYFAPFLSLMEASSILEDRENAPIVDWRSLAVISEILDLEDKDSPEAESARLLRVNEQPLRLPPNLFYVGTVNVDETTYMFSPKVLDRAHVLEIRPLLPSRYVAGGVTEDRIGLSQANELLRESIDRRENELDDKGDPSSVLDELVDKCGFDQAGLEKAKEIVLRTLDGCFQLLSPIGFEFGYRVVKEVHAYMLVWAKAKLASGMAPAQVLSNWIEGLDLALFQKALPKLHGNRAALGDSLRAISAFLSGAYDTSANPAKYSLGIDAVVGIPKAGAIELPEGVSFKRCVGKLDEMHARLLSRNYASFVK